MPKTTPEWFDELEKMFRREEISQKEYEKETKSIWRTAKEVIIEHFKELGKRIFSIKYPTYLGWSPKGKTTAYSKRIMSYMLKHPKATLKEARGHGKKKK